MGRVAGSYGVRGWIKVVPGGGVAETLAGGREWWIAERPYEVSEARAHGATVVGKLAGIETREQARDITSSPTWSGWKCATSRTSSWAP